MTTSATWHIFVLASGITPWMQCMRSSEQLMIEVSLVVCRDRPLISGGMYGATYMGNRT
jgi:hypothetical protein